MKRIILKITDSCNLRCSYCYYKDTVYEKKFMNYETYLKIFNNIIKRFPEETDYSINFYGGEPLLNKEIFEKYFLIREIYPDKNFYFYFNTNFSVVPDYFYNFLEREYYDFCIGPFIFLSINGHLDFLQTDRPFENGENSFEKIFSNFFKLNSFLEKKKIKKEIVKIDTSLTNTTIPYMYDIFTFFYKLGYKVYFYIVGDSITPDNIILFSDNLRKIKYFLDTKKDDFLRFVPFANFKNDSCGYNSEDNLSIDVNGFLTSCYATFGDIFIEDLTKSFSIDFSRLELIKNDMMYSVLGKCTDCEFYKTCYVCGFQNVEDKYRVLDSNCFLNYEKGKFLKEVGVIK